MPKVSVSNFIVVIYAHVILSKIKSKIENRKFQAGISTKFKSFYAK